MISIEKVTVLPKAEGKSVVETVFVDEAGTKTTLTFSGQVRSSLTVDGDYLNVAIRLHPHKDELERAPLLDGVVPL